MLAELHLLFARQLAGLAEQFLAHADLADVVEDARVAHDARLLGGQSESERRLLAVAGDAAQMPLGVRILDLHPARHREHHALGALELVGQPLDPELRAEARAQQSVLERLVDEVVRARLHRLQVVRLPAEHGQ